MGRERGTNALYVPGELISHGPASGVAEPYVRDAGHGDERFAGHPINRFRRAAKGVSEGDFSESPPARFPSGAGIAGELPTRAGPDTGIEGGWATVRRDRRLRRSLPHAQTATAPSILIEPRVKEWAPGL